MIGRDFIRSLPVCRFLLRAAGLLVPSQNRAEWTAEWEAELWHVCRSRDDHDLAADEHQNCFEPATFCLGAFQDAWWLRRNNLRPARRRVDRHGSPLMCLISLAGLAAASLLLALCLPAARKAILPVPYADSNQLVLISPGGESMSQSPPILLADYRSWQTSTRRLFTELAYYQPIVKRVHIAPHRAPELSIIRASASLFDLLNIPAFGVEIATRYPTAASAYSQRGCVARVFRQRPRDHRTRS